ncbi:hypothetical protein EHS25_004495 [Saitozyma podzolica]|uniref:DUF7918 domain-containing protein n=1 Tax=Saitozyma podzolica TaxID=1890683 RepID=A0A427YU86_9TREE|nr:hypothetical protein EHS25_004495 [Saitozyma podzolica]
MRLGGQFSGCEAWVQDANGNRLNEYEVKGVEGKDGEPDQMECYLECEDGQEFTVVLRRAAVEEPEIGELRERDDVRAIMFADGRRMGARSLVRGRWPEATFDSAREVKDGQWYQSKYRFAPIRLTDNDDEAFHDYNILQKLGTLHLDLHLGVHRGRKRYTGGTGPAMEIGPIHESSKKGLIGSWVGKGQSTLARAPASGTRFDRRSRHGADYRVVFKYRTKELLMAGEVIERPQDQAGVETVGTSAQRKRQRSPSIEFIAEYIPTESHRLKKIKRLEADLRSLRGGGEVKDEPASQEQEGDSRRDAIDMTQE